MKIAIKPWGHSAAVRLPKAVMQAAGLKLSDTLEITTSGNQVILTPIHVAEIQADEEARLLAMLIAGGQAHDRYEELNSCANPHAKN